MTDPTSRIFDVVLVSRDQMNVKVRDGLAGGLADVDADVEAVGEVFGRDGFFGDRERAQKLALFLPRSVEPRGDVALRDDESVAITDGVGVPEAENVLASVEHAFGIGMAEGAW